jgi:hypothetical protein
VSQKLIRKKWLEHLRALAFCIVLHPKILLFLQRLVNPGTSHHKEVHTHK